MIHEKYVFTFTFSEDLKLVSEPSNIEINNDAGYLHIQFEQSEGKLVVTREIKLSKKIIDTNMYDGFREIMNTWNNVNLQKIICKK
jgi:hypothetical protein